MYAPVIFALCLAVTVYGFPESQIVGGHDAPAGKFPYQVSLKENGRHFCGGSIVNNHYILTAAHCVVGIKNLKHITVQAGTTHLNARGHVHTVEKITHHPNYNSAKLVNDVAVIRVHKPIAFNKMVKAIKLATSKVATGAKVVLSGWGRTRAGGSIPNNLQEIDLKVVSQARCKKAHTNVRDSHICTLTRHGQGACNGDSGGPLVHNGVQVGIVSYGHPCGVGYPDVFTRVSSFVPWIRRQFIGSNLSLGRVYKLIDRVVSYSIANLAKMYIPAIFALCLAVTVYGFPEGQIVGGHDAPAGKYPYQVSLKNNGRHFCGGSIINDRYVLTAAHCVVGIKDVSVVSVQAGTNLLSARGSVYAVEKITAHPDYNSMLIVNDVAVIRVEKTIAFNSLVQPIKLAAVDAPEGSGVVLTGWGTTRNGGSVPDNLQEIDLKIYAQAQCKKTHWNLKDSHICTFTKSGEGACHGDSGGPLVSGEVQVGIVSFGRPCGIGYPDVFTRVSSFLPWIQQQLK
nr:transmembrane protease serine 9-like [Megalopta genalis]